MQILEIAIKVCLVPLPCQARAGCRVPLNFVERLFEQVPQTPQKRPTGTPMRPDLPRMPPRRKTSPTSLHGHRDRPKTTDQITVAVRIPKDMLAAIDAWRAKQPGRPKPVRPEAVRPLIAIALHPATHRPSPVRSATDLTQQTTSRKSAASSQNSCARAAV